ncbi:MAG: 4Fe-4S binding protein, partial [Deltaproteobacteria bacterium]|nr:4Fe-4S binding protein [Deltaproteobacteria bacterium]
DIDIAKCMYCGLCSEPCPTGAIHHTTEFEGADYSLESLIRRFIAEPVVAYKPKKGPESDPDLGRLLERGMKYVDEWAQPAADKAPAAKPAAAPKPATPARTPAATRTPAKPAAIAAAEASAPAPAPAKREMAESVAESTSAETAINTPSAGEGTAPRPAKDVASKDGDEPSEGSAVSERKNFPSS